MPRLKAVIFGLRDVIVHQGSMDPALFTELGRLLKLLQQWKVTPVFLANRPWSVQNSHGKVRDLQEMITGHWGAFPWYVALRDGTPYKPQKDATDSVLKKHGWQTNEVVYVGNTVEDMRTAVNGDLLFLNAKWHGEATEYGFEFDSPKAIARFVDVFCRRDALWFYEIEDGDLRFYALGPFSTLKSDTAVYSEDAKAAAKFGGGTVPFWTQYLVSTIYLSGLHQGFNYAASYPGHLAGHKKNIIHDVMVTFTKCFRKSYLPDLVVRHTTALKSQTARIKGLPLDHKIQLNSIKLTKLPLRGDSDKRYKRPPLGAGKTVLVVDDFCTEGFSLEAARNFVQQTGAKAIVLAWLKTINRSYARLDLNSKFDPYIPQKFTQIPASKYYSYHGHIVDLSAKDILGERLALYEGWDWPAGV